MYVFVTTHQVKLCLECDLMHVACCLSADIIDPAVLRPGRLDKTLYVGLPPPKDRHAILLTITKVTALRTTDHQQSLVTLHQSLFNMVLIVCATFSCGDVVPCQRDNILHKIKLKRLNLIRLII